MPFTGFQRNVAAALGHYSAGQLISLARHRLLPGRPHRFGKRLPAPLQLGSDPGRQIRVSPQLADKFADDIRRGDIPGLRVTAKEPVQVRHQVDCDPGRTA